MKRLTFLFVGGGTYKFDTETDSTAYNIETALVNGGNTEFIVVKDDKRGTTVNIRRINVNVLTMESI